MCTALSPAARPPVCSLSQPEPVSFSPNRSEATAFPPCQALRGCVWPGWGEGTLNKQPWPQPVLRLTTPAPPQAPRQRRLAGPCEKEPGASRIHLARKGLVLCLPHPQIAPGCPSCSPATLGLSPPNPPSGERSRGPPALDRKLSALLAHRAGSLTTGKASRFPPAPLAETQPLFPAAARKSPRPGLPRGPCSLQISRSGNFPCAVFQASRASRTKGRERSDHPRPCAEPPPIRGRGDPEDRDHPFWEGQCLGKQPQEDPG